MHIIMGRFTWQYTMIYMQGFIKHLLQGGEGTSARMPNNGVQSIQLQRMFPNPKSERDKRVNHL